MRIAIVGAGGVGGYFGARLARAGTDVAFIARGEHLAALRREGLHVECDDEELILRSVRATDSSGEIGEVDAVLVAVKAWQLEEAARSIAPLLGADTAVVPLQNGVEAPAQLAAELGEQYVLGGFCWTTSAIVAPGRIRSLGSEHSITFGELGRRRSERAGRLLAVLARAGITAHVPDDIQAAMWEKFLVASALGGVGAVTRAPVGELRRRPDTRRLLEEIMREILAVAHARGIDLRSTLVEETMARLDTLPAAATNSLQRDIVAGRPSELEARNGAVVRLGRESGVETPVSASIYDALLPMELRARRDAGL